MRKRRGNIIDGKRKIHGQKIEHMGIKKNLKKKQVKKRKKEAKVKERKE